MTILKKTGMISVPSAASSQRLISFSPKEALTKAWAQGCSPLNNPLPFSTARLISTGSAT